MSLFQLHKIRSPYPKTAGFSLVEILLALALLGFVTVAMSTFLVKGNAISSAMSQRYREATEVHSVILDIQRDLAQGAYISDNSHTNRLEYTTYDSSGNASKKIYRITTISGLNYLQLSTDGGTTWRSPYRLSLYTQYKLTGTPLFLYAQDANNCTSFVDSNANGVWQTGVDSAGVTLSCGATTTTTPLLTTPSDATKVVMSGFVFSSTTGNPLVSRSLPSNIFMASPQPVVISTAAAVAGVKDAPLFKSFDTATANSRFGTGFDARGITWDPSRQRLLVVGHHTTSSNNKIYQVERNGVLIGPGSTISDSSVQLDGVALMSDNQSVWALDATAKKVYLYTVTPGASSLLSPVQTFNLATPNTGSPALTGVSNLVNTPTSIAYDANTPTEFYIAGTDPADSGLKLFEISSLTGALATSTGAFATGKFTLPAAFDATHPPGGITIEPTTGDVLVVRNYVNGVSPNQTIDIYRVSRSAGTSAIAFSVNISDLVSSATGTTGYWGIGYNPETNHIFLTDSATDKVYEVIPSVLISPRS